MNNGGSKSPTTEQKLEWTKLCACVCGLLFSFVAYGIFQEKCLTQPYKKINIGPPNSLTSTFDEEYVYFTDSPFLVFLNRIVACIFASIVIFYQGVSFQPIAPIIRYCCIALSNFCATWCQYESLKYVSFPMATLGKTGKMIPVLIFGTLFFKKNYNKRDYLIALSITFGTTIFILTGSVVAKSDKFLEVSSISSELLSSFNAILIGLALIVCFLALDGLTSTCQETLFKGYQMPVYSQMLHVNLCSAVLVGLTCVIRGTFFSSLSFALNYPQMLFDAFLLSCCAAFGQLCIYYTIAVFGALTYATIMTTRHIISITVSCILFFHPLSMWQLIGTSIVFIALYWKAFSSRKLNPIKQ